ncbi:Hypothetical predicted protein [Mytilus galloprovincialis]|uniref:Uncharacterized protein n=1 Tax=Mytilus galloprovincialis TaxID=29158 RepID=A0A8B6G6Z1_MYTGA|nr:Hypothetical predicted protein [Mytilus galloprovincialis]
MVIPIANICESQEGVMRCMYSGEGQYVSLQQLDNCREIYFARFFRPSTLFIDNAQHLTKITIQSGSVRCKDITTNNPKVLITIADIPCKDQTDESYFSREVTTHEPEHERMEEPKKVSVNNNQSGDGQRENNKLQHQGGDEHPFAKMTYETFDKMQSKKAKKDKIHNSGKRRNSWLVDI